MAEVLYDSPRLNRDLISSLYHRARTERIPMTALASWLVRDGFTRQGVREWLVLQRVPPRVGVNS